MNTLKGRNASEKGSDNESVSSVEAVTGKMDFILKKPKVVAAGKSEKYDSDHNMGGVEKSDGRVSS